MTKPERKKSIGGKILARRGRRDQYDERKTQATLKMIRAVFARDDHKKDKPRRGER